MIYSILFAVIVGGICYTSGFQDGRFRQAKVDKPKRDSRGRFRK